MAGELFGDLGPTKAVSPHRGTHATCGHIAVYGFKHVCGMVSIMLANL